MKTETIFHKNKLIRFLAMALCVITLVGTQATVFATENSTEAEDDYKPYLCLGADLTADEQHTVLALLGIDATMLDQYDVVYVNNEQEHQYLGSYIPADKIGTRALSCVMIVETAPGSGINVQTININYCTPGMYENALTTAGVTDANVTVVGPFEISGTAALLGTFQAYEQMTGETLDEDVVDAALDELITTGALEESVDADPEEIEALIAELKQMLADGELDTEQDILDAIAELEEEYDIYFTDEEKQTIVDLIQKFKTVDLEWLDGLYNSGFFSQIGEFFSGLWDTILSWFH